MTRLIRAAHPKPARPTYLESPRYFGWQRIGRPWSSLHVVIPGGLLCGHHIPGAPHQTATLDAIPPTWKSCETCLRLLARRTRGAG